MSDYIKQGKISKKELLLLRKDVEHYRDKAFTATVTSGAFRSKVSDTRISDVYFPRATEYFNTFNILQSIVMQEYIGTALDMTKIAEVQYVRYHEGGHFDWHRDNISYDKKEGSAERGLTFSINISYSSEYEGGELLVKRPNGEVVTLSKEPGSYIVFPSFLRHKACKITAGTREAIVVWTHFNKNEAEITRAWVESGSKE